MMGHQYKTIRHQYNTNKAPNYRLVLSLILIAVLLFFGLWVFSTIAVYLIVSVAIVSIGSPFTEYFSRSQFFGISIPRIIAVLLTFLILSAFASAFVLLFIPLIKDQVDVISKLDFEGINAYIAEPLGKVEDIIMKYDVSAEVERGFLAEEFSAWGRDLLAKLNYGLILERVLELTSTIVTGALAILFISFFLMYERGLAISTVMKIVPNRYFELFLSAYYRIQKLLSNYLLGLVIQILSIFSLAGVGLMLVGVKYGLTIALFAAVANLIPYAGPFLGALFGLITTLLTYGQYSESTVLYLLIGKIFIVFMVVQLIDNIIIQPIVFSKSVKAHPLIIFITVFIGAILGGIMGMILAIPGYTFLKVSFQELYNGFRKYRSFKNSTV